MKFLLGVVINEAATLNTPSVRSQALAGAARVHERQACPAISAGPAAHLSGCGVGPKR
jgi:hypothetical protein